MFVLFLVQTISPFTNNIGPFCGVIFFEGSLGGLAYVNTFDRVLKKVRPILTLDVSTLLHLSVVQFGHLIPRGEAILMLKCSRREDKTL